MSEKPKPAKPPKLKPGYEHWGEMKPPVYPPRSPGLGGWLVGILTAWKR